MINQIQIYISKGASLLSSSGLFLMVVATLIQVLCRFVFGFSLVWVEEASRYSLIFITLFGALVVYEKNEMIRLTYLEEKISPRVCAVLHMIVGVFLLVFYVFFIKEAFISMSSFALKESPSLSVPLSFFFAFVPISQIGMVVLVVFRCIQNMKIILRK